jgi:transposase
VSLQPQPIGPVPEETARVARAAFPNGNVYMRLRDELGSLSEDASFAPLFHTRGQPAETPWRLARVLGFQFAEDLSDRQVAEAVRGRIDWKYAPGLELTDPGFDAPVLSEFRTRPVAGAAEQQLLDSMLTRLRMVGVLKARGRQRTDSPHVLAAIRVLNRLELVGETMRRALNTLATVAPEWLRVQLDPTWAERYGPRFADDRLPKEKATRQGLAEIIGTDGFRLLTAIDAPAAPTYLPAGGASRRDVAPGLAPAGRRPDRAGALARGGGSAAGQPDDQLAARPGGPLRGQAPDVLDWLQGPSDRDR